MSTGTVFRFSSRAKLRRAETWNSKRRQTGWQKRYEKGRALDRAKALKRTRKPASLAKGLTAYRKKRKLSRADFAEELKIDRRTLYNYESGSFPVPGNVIEKIIARGDVELSEIFGLPPEDPHIFRQLDNARLAISLFAACLEKYRTGPIDEIVTEVVLKTAEWPPSVRRTEHSINRVAVRLMNELSDRVMQEESDRKQNDPDYESSPLDGPTEEDLSKSSEMQFNLIQQAYATGDEEQFETAIMQVANARQTTRKNNTPSISKSKTIT